MRQTLGFIRLQS